jgi:hypothetical protein
MRGEGVENEGPRVSDQFGRQKVGEAFDDFVYNRLDFIGWDLRRYGGIRHGGLLVGVLMTDAPGRSQVAQVSS